MLEDTNDNDDDDDQNDSTAYLRPPVNRFQIEQRTHFNVFLFFFSVFIRH